MTRIEYLIILDGPPEEAWPARKDLQTHLDALQVEFQKSGLKVDYEWFADKTASSGSKAIKLAAWAGKGVKAGWDYLFKEEKADGTKTS